MEAKFPFLAPFPGGAGRRLGFPAGPACAVAMHPRCHAEWACGEAKHQVCHAWLCAVGATRLGCRAWRPCAAARHLGSFAALQACAAGTRPACRAAAAFAEGRCLASHGALAFLVAIPRRLPYAGRWSWELQLHHWRLNLSSLAQSSQPFPARWHDGQQISACDGTQRNMLLPRGVATGDTKMLTLAAKR